MSSGSLYLNSGAAAIGKGGGEGVGWVERQRDPTIAGTEIVVLGLARARPNLQAGGKGRDQPASARITSCVGCSGAGARGARSARRRVMSAAIMGRPKR